MIQTDPWTVELVAQLNEQRQCCCPNLPGGGDRKCLRCETAAMLRALFAEREEARQIAWGLRNQWCNKHENGVYAPLPWERPNGEAA